MALFVDPTGKGTYGIGICARCQNKFSLTELFDDRDQPGLLVCREDRDDIGQDKFKPRTPENMTLRVYRPEDPLPNPTAAELLILNPDGSG